MFAAAVDVVVIIFNIALNYCLFFSSFLSISIPFVGGRRRRCCVFCDELSVRVHNSWHRKKTYEHTKICLELDQKRIY